MGTERFRRGSGGGTRQLDLREGQAGPVADIETYGVSRWLGELAWYLKAGTYRSNAVRRVLIPKKRRAESRPWGILCIRAK